jgi:hypothetical protein
MSDPVSLASLFEAAEQAAVGGDFPAAARLLAQAAGAQHATLGPDHPDLANTLNNLAVAHERSGHLDEAERQYRRSHAIAARTLPPDHPLVTTSAQNLREFCEANGRPVDAAAVTPSDAAALRLAPADDPRAASPRATARPPQAAVAAGPIEPLAITFATEPPPSAPARPAPARPAAPPARPAPPAPMSTTPAAGRPPAPAATPPVRTSTTKPAAPAPASASAHAPAPAAVRPTRSRLSVPVLIAFGAVAVLVIWWLAGRGPAAPPATPEAAAPEASRAPATSPAPAATAAARPIGSPSATTPGAASSGVNPSPGPTAAAAPAAAAPPAASSTPDGVTVGDAELCRTLSSGYRCQPAGTTVRPGSLTFYTRLVARQNTSVVHRWYRGSELRQSVRLQIPARRQGFRTFSRATVSPSEGEWRVELRSRDGQLLHAERFTVR